MALSEYHELLRSRAAWQMGYAGLFTLFALWPNLRMAPSLVLIVATALTAIWLVGGLAAWAKVTRADELLLCGSVAPVLVGLTQLAYRLHFLASQAALARPEVASDSAAGFLAVWTAELLLVLTPGLLFVWWNARALQPVQPSRPVSASKRT